MGLIRSAPPTRFYVATLRHYLGSDFSRTWGSFASSNYGAREEAMGANGPLNPGDVPAERAYYSGRTWTRPPCCRCNGTIIRGRNPGKLKL
jgi:hypothetical protein